MLIFKNRNRAKIDTGIDYLGYVGSSSKIKKNSKVLNIDTFVLYLAPYKSSGYNVCHGATKECIAGCLNTSGRVIMEINSDNENRILNARIKKTKLFHENREFFMDWLVAEIEAAKNLSHKKGNEFAVRLNGTSDINWNRIYMNGKTIFEIFSDIQFYDYTKLPQRFNNIPANYHLTLSFTGYNWLDCVKVLEQNYNVAVIFNVQSFYNSKVKNKLPDMFKGYKVINGDITDYRPFDGKGVIVGLHWKQIANKAIDKEIRQSKFVAKVEDKKTCIFFGK